MWSCIIQFSHKPQLVLIYTWGCKTAVYRIDFFRSISACDFWRKMTFTPIRRAIEAGAVGRLFDLIVFMGWCGDGLQELKKKFVDVIIYHPGNDISVTVAYRLPPFSSCQIKPIRLQQKFNTKEVTKSKRANVHADSA